MFDGTVVVNFVEKTSDSYILYDNENGSKVFFFKIHSFDNFSFHPCLRLRGTTTKLHLCRNQPLRRGRTTYKNNNTIFRISNCNIRG